MAHSNGDVAIISFAVIDNDTDELIEAVDPAQPMALLTGVGTLPDAVEQSLVGLEAGGAFEVAIDAAYGPKTGKKQTVKKSELPKNVRDRLRKGLAFAAGGSGDSSVTLFVSDIKGSRVTLTVDHPLAGRSIKFAGMMHVSRPATDSEKAHGHAHGAGGHHH